MKRLAFSFLTALVAGCAQFSPDGGMDHVARGVRKEIGKHVIKITTPEQAARARAQVISLIAGPLSADAAVQITLLNNRTLQAAYNDLGISEAAYVQASLPPNPGLSILRVAGTGVVNFELRLIEEIVSLFTLPQRSAIAAEKFHNAKLQAIAATLRLAADTRRAHIRAIAARQQVAYLQQTRATVDTAVRLISGMGAAGGGDQLDQAELAAFRAELGTRVDQAELTARRNRETLVRLLGLSGTDTAIALPTDLDSLPATPGSAIEAEIEAVNRRVDLEIARREVAALAKSLALTEATRYISMLQLAGIFSNESANPLTNADTAINRSGLQVDLQIPVFDTGTARTRSARESYSRAINLLVAKAVDVRSEARIAYESYRATYDIARSWQDRVVPLRQAVSREIMLRYSSGVLVGEGLRVDVFKYLSDARVRIAANAASLDARRDFLLASTDLQAALTIGGVTANDNGENSTVATTTTMR
jgi:outer membrane protein TolC